MSPCFSWMMAPYYLLVLICPQYCWAKDVLFFMIYSHIYRKNENKNVALGFEVSSRGHHVLFFLSRNEHRVLQKIYFPLITSGNVSLYFKESLVINEKIPKVWIKYLLIWHSYWYHCGFLEHWNSQKSLTKIRQFFHEYLMSRLKKYAKKNHNGFLR